MKWTTFLDKVYGCWIGKCVSGTIGAPYEGYKGILNIQYSPKLIENMLPNDDLDLQVLWLEVLEQKGPDFTSADLAKIFYEKCPYSPGEYAIFKKNYKLGIQPPLSGKYNNNYYLEGMGCPIRSEIWACIAPGDGKLAAACAAKDGCLDHYGESIIAEQYLAALEAIAFLWEGDLRSLVVEALSYIPSNSKFYTLVQKVVAWCDADSNWRTVYGRIIREYGHSDCTNMFQNMGVTLLSLLLGKGDLIETTIMALNCGFDTDCTCATVGSVIGILQGGQALMDKYQFPEQTYKLGVNTTRRSDKVYDLAVDTARAALLFADQNKLVKLVDYPTEYAPVLPVADQSKINVIVSYQDDYPVIGLGEVRQVTLSLFSKEEVTGVIQIKAPESFTVSPASQPFAANKTGTTLVWEIQADPKASVLWNRNPFSIHLELADGRQQIEQFGLAGAQIWKAYGPFWENVIEVPAPGAGESYYAGLGGANPDESLTNTRQFHINMKAKWEQEYMEPYLLENNVLPEDFKQDPAYQGFPAIIYEDLFRMEDVMMFHGPCILYLVRQIVSPDDRTVCLQIGHSDKFKLYQDGVLLAEADHTENWTPENIHKLNINLKKGANRFVLKMARTNGASDFSLIFTEHGACTTMISELGSANMV